jgi:hypothetical protein
LKRADKIHRLEVYDLAVTDSDARRYNLRKK